MSWVMAAGGAVLFLIGLLFLLLILPVTYEVRLSPEEIEGTVSFLGGAVKKSLSRSFGKGPDKAEEEAGRAAGPEEKDAGREEAPAPKEREGKAPSPCIEDKEKNIIKGNAESPAEEGAAPEDKAAESPGGTEEDGKDGGSSGAKEPHEAAEGGKPSSWEVFHFALENGALQEALRCLSSLYRHSRPKTCRMEGAFGTGDPMATGIAAGMAEAFFPAASSLDFSYTERIFSVHAAWKGRIIPLCVLCRAGQFCFSRPVREVRRFRKGKQE